MLLEDREADKDAVLGFIRALPKNLRFSRQDAWLALSLDPLLKKWQRWEAYKFLVYRCLHYPLAPNDFAAQAIEPFGIDRRQWIDMSMAQVLPLQRKVDDLIFMINLPLMSAIGPASIYFAISGATKQVERVGLHPEML